MCRVELLVNNSKELDKVGGIFTGSIFRKCSALSLAIKGEKAHKDKINEAIEIIKRNTSVLSNFRGNNLLIVATTMSLSENMEKALEDINNIYNKLKEKFFTNQYLILGAMAIYNCKDKLNIDEVVKNTRLVYNSMKDRHIFLTGQEDIVVAAMIAINSRNIRFTMEETEVYYERLNKNGFRKGNNLQSLSNILVLFEGNIEEKVYRVMEVEKALKKHSVPMKGYGIPMLAVASIVDGDLDVFAEKVRHTNEALRKEKGFGNLSLGYQIRSILAIGVVMIEYIETLNNKESIVSIANNITLTIEIALEVAITVMMVGVAASAASTSSGGC